MDRIIKIYGTKATIAESILSQLQIQNAEEASAMKLFIDSLVDGLEANFRCLSDDERIRKESPRGYDSSQSFLTEDAVYFINIKKFTFLLFSVIAKLNIEEICGSVVGAFIENFLEAQFQGEDLALFHRINKATGECCIVLEARNARKKGISKGHFSKTHGLRKEILFGKECINNDIICGLRRGTQCLCDEDQTEAICEALVENRILIKKGTRYYYTDFL